MEDFLFLLARVLKPDHILTALTGYEDIVVSIPIQIGNHGIVSHLITTKKVTGEVAFAVVLVPDCQLGLISDRAHINIAIPIDISEIGGVSGVNRIINHMLFPIWSLKPDNPHPMATGR